MTRRVVVFGVAITLVVAVAVAAIERSHHGAAPAAASAATDVATATVTRANLAASQLVNATLGYAPSPPVIVRAQGIYTSLPAEGTQIQPGQAIAVVNERPVILLLGSVGAWRRFRVGMTDGDDVAQLEQALVALGFGFGVKVDRHFDHATTAAIRRWQANLGEPVTGIVNDGDVVFLPTSIRVGLTAAAVGGLTVSNQPPFAATSTIRIVQANLDASRQQGITVGTSVTIDLPGGTRTTGKISALGAVASTPAADNGTGSSRPTVSLEVSLDDPAAGGQLDQQPVQLELVTDSRENVLAVPVTALLALAEGGYGVEVVPTSGPHAIVAVTPGLFASGLVEITGGSLAAGAVVVVAR